MQKVEKKLLFWFFSLFSVTRFKNASVNTVEILQI